MSTASNYLESVQYNGAISYYTSLKEKFLSQYFSTSNNKEAIEEAKKKVYEDIGKFFQAEDKSKQDTFFRKKLLPILNKFVLDDLSLAEIERIKNANIKPTEEVNKVLKKHNSSEIRRGVKLAELLRRSELCYEALKPIDIERPRLTKQEREEVEIQVKYEGYIKLQKAQVEKFKKLEEKKLDETISYANLKGLSLEARQKLDKIKPTSIGQASRISGVSPADISVLLIYLEQQKNKK